MRSNAPNPVVWRDYAEARPGHEHDVSGALKLAESVWSPQLENQRDILVHLPPGYAAGRRRYPAVYLHDGQNLFDPATSYAGETWQVDETMQALGQEGFEAIVVALPHMGERRVIEYDPFTPAGQGEAYLAFVVETVKPLIDSAFRTLPGRQSTGILGSSMGGLISLYAFFRHAQVFGFVGAMSPALWFGGRAIYPYVRQAPYTPGRIYLDHGTREGSARPMYALLLEKGYRPDHTLRYVKDEAGEHRESAWARRLPDALRFLLTPPPDAG